MDQGESCLIEEIFELTQLRDNLKQSKDDLFFLFWLLVKKIFLLMNKWLFSKCFYDNLRLGKSIDDSYIAAKE